MKSPLLSATIASVITLSTMSDSLAMDTLDQIHVPAETVSFQVWEDIYAAQSFTVGLSGILSRVDLRLSLQGYQIGDVWLDIRPTIGDLPSESNIDVLATAVIPHSSITSPGTGEWVSVDLESSGLKVTPGERLTIVVRSEPLTDATFWWFGTSFGNFYLRGEAYRRDVRFGPSPWVSEGADYDLGFKTYVNTIPEPEVSVLMLAGLFAVALAARRRYS